MKLPRFDIAVYSDENISLKVSNLGGYTVNFSTDTQFYYWVTFACTRDSYIRIMTYLNKYLSKCLLFKCIGLLISSQIGRVDYNY